MTTIGKVAAAVGSITGVSGIAATSAVLAGGGEASNVSPTDRIENQSTDNTEHQPEKKKRVFTKPNWKPSSIPELANAKDIQNKHKDLPCVNDHFPEVVSWTGEGTPSSDVKDSYTFPNDPNTKSCLAMEYYKQKYKDSYWWGEFRLIWSTKNENTNIGFLTVIDAKTSDGNLIGSSAAYIMKKSDTEDKWRVLQTRGQEEHKVSDVKGLESLIPQMGFPMMLENLEGVRWGFEPTDTWICKDEVCGEAEETANHKNIIWEFTGGGSGDGLNEWCRYLNNWLESNFKWGNLIKGAELVRGKWTRRSSEN